VPLETAPRPGPNTIQYVSDLNQDSGAIGTDDTYSASGALRHWYRLGYDDQAIGQDCSQLAIDAGNQAPVSDPPGPGVVWLGWPTDYADPIAALTTDIPTQTRDGVPI